MFCMGSERGVFSKIVISPDSETLGVLVKNLVPTE